MAGRGRFALALHLPARFGPKAGSGPTGAARTKAGAKVVFGSQNRFRI